SIVAAIFLTSMKLFIGILTNSLGILSEALHSGLDLVATVVTYFGVRTAAYPADEKHLFGHGKVENLSALFETLLLLLTCIWIIWEAFMRLFFHTEPVTMTTVGIAVMAISIVTDYWRSRTLSRAAKKYNSQALAADALHFSSDILSSGVVIVGLVCVQIGFSQGDALAALGVALVIVVVSLRLGKESLEDLLDVAPKGLDLEIKQLVESIVGVEKCTRVRCRQSGDTIFSDITILVDGHLPTLPAHHITKTVENNLQEKLEKKLDIVIHVEPAANPPLHLAEQLQNFGNQIPEIKGIHNVKTWKIKKTTYLDLHLEMQANLSLKEAHDIADEFEKLVKEELGKNTVIESHLEPTGASIHPNDEEIIDIAKKIIEKFPTDDCHQVFIKIDENTGKKSLSLHCRLPEEISLEEAHSVSTEIEMELRKQIEFLAEVTIHLEPINKEY
ncbi:MAG: cation diffusion facilitator family transporter, partial [Candidatus Hodarchaeota archaeon]